MAALNDDMVPLPYQLSRRPNWLYRCSNLKLKPITGYISINPVKSDNYSYIPFIIRTYEGIDGIWSSYLLNFVASDKTEIISGYQLVDGGS